MTGEKQLQNEIRRALSNHGVVLRLNVGVFKTQDGRYVDSGLPPGVSDLLFIGNGYTAFIEIKTATGRLSKAQANFIKHMLALGHRAGVARSVADALAIIGEDV